MDQAAGCAADIAQSGRCLQLSPASENFDLFKNFKARELAFTDEVQTLCA